MDSVLRFLGILLLIVCKDLLRLFLVGFIFCHVGVLAQRVEHIPGATPETRLKRHGEKMPACFFYTGVDACCLRPEDGSCATVSASFTVQHIRDSGKNKMGE